MAAGIACALAGVASLRIAWSRRGGAWLIVLGAALITCGVIAWRGSGAAWDKALALAALTSSLAALLMLACTAEYGGRRPRPTPIAAAAVTGQIQAARLPWRGLARTFLAGPVSGVAAVGLAAAVAIRGPGSEADRLVAAGFIAPIAWALGWVWATTDRRLLRVGAGLIGITALSSGWAKM